MRTIFYLGPERTFSHEAAGLLRQMRQEWQGAHLVPCATAEAIFVQLISDPNSGAIVPIFNREQGDVFDFSRFFLLDQLTTLELTVAFYLYGHTQTVQDILTIYTKDTILPQVSDWLKGLPSQVQLVATPQISSAEAARRAAAEPPHSAAICSAAAGEAAGLQRIEPVASNRPGNFTRFGLFRRPAAWQVPPADLFDRVEFPLELDAAALSNLRHGRHTLVWAVSLSNQTVLHLGHLTTLLTLRKFARLGNQAIILWRMAEPLVPGRAAQFEQAVRTIIDVPLLADFRPDDGRRPAGAILIAGLEAAAQLKQQGQRAILLDHVPGADGYAKMSTRRGNTIPWPVPAALRDTAVVQEILATHFTPKRQTQADFPISLVES